MGAQPLRFSSGERLAGNPGEKGATYYAIEGRTSRSTTRFRDGHVAVTERGTIGDLTAMVMALQSRPIRACT